MPYTVYSNSLSLRYSCLLQQELLQRELLAPNIQQKHNMSSNNACDLRVCQRTVVPKVTAIYTGWYSADPLRRSPATTMADQVGLGPLVTWLPVPSRQVQVQIFVGALCAAAMTAGGLWPLKLPMLPGGFGRGICPYLALAAHKNRPHVFVQWASFSIHRMFGYGSTTTPVL